MIELLHPGYKPPNRKQIGNELLDTTYDSIKTMCKKVLNNKSVCMSLDGWSNIHNDSIVCISLTDVINGEVYLVDTIDTEDNSHTSEYLLSLVFTCLKKCQQEGYGCTVRSFVTDNAANMSKMRQDLSKSEVTGVEDIITYGCSAHILNLLAHDIDLPLITEHVKQIIKYFRNTHFAAAKYKQAGGKALVLPLDVRWNTLADSLESYIDNWTILSKICSENRTAIDTTIQSKIHNIGIKNNAQDLLLKFKEIALALDKIQSDNCTIGRAVEIWLELIDYFSNQSACSEKDLEFCRSRYNMAIHEPHLLANLLDPRYEGMKLSQTEMDNAKEYASIYYPEAMPDIIKYKAKSSPFKSYLFTPTSLKDIKPTTWWHALRDSLHPVTFNLVEQLHTAVASSAGIERLFSMFGIVHTKLRNRLGTEKASKLVTVLKALNTKSYKTKYNEH